MSSDDRRKPPLREMTRREKWAVRLGMPYLAVTGVLAVLIWPLFWFGHGDLIQWISIVWWGAIMPVGVASFILAKGDFTGVARMALRNFRASHKM